MKSVSPESRWVIYGALAANAAVCVAKFTAALLSGSAALLSEGIHSLADTGNEILLLLGLRRSQKPADSSHPYGYGKEQYFWSLIVALVLFSVGGGTSIYEGVRRLMHPQRVEHSLANYVVIGVAFVFESGSLWLGIRNLRARQSEGSLLSAIQRSKDPSVFTVVAEDIAAIAGLVAAFIGVLTSDLFDAAWCDAVGSIAVGATLCVVAFFLASESHKLLVGESGSQELLDHVQRITREDPSVKSVGETLSMQLGPEQVLINLTVEFEPGTCSTDLPGAIQRLERRIREAHPEITRLYVEASSLAGH